jgi:hypothetical protein
VLVLHASSCKKNPNDRSEAARAYFGFVMLQYRHMVTDGGQMCSRNIQHRISRPQAFGPNSAKERQKDNNTVPIEKS